MRTRLSKIREKLLKEGKLLKYLTYAFGEIIIVVVGIIVALYLNNRNQERGNHKLEIQYYQSMKTQLQDDLNTLIDVMDYDQHHFDQFICAKKLILLKDENQMDTLGKIALKMVRYGDFRRKSNIYQTLVSSGEIVIINNKKIKEKLESLEQDYLYINRLEENHETIVYSHIVPDLRQVIRFDPVKVEDPGALYSYKFLNNFVILITIMAEKKKAYLLAEKEIKSILELIDQELKD
ncbi:MAG: DUF6090 family protein [Bacteroidetes bacterium]|nr:DUF6090 family protein [Bacteroidota bacterium]